MNSAENMEGERILTLSDLVKYPFMPEAADEVRRLDFRIEHLLNPDYEPVLERAEKRIIEALTTNPPEVSYNPHEYSEYVEILSFPAAIVLAAALANDYVKRRYALAEARRAYGFLRTEKEDKIINIAGRFGWRIRALNMQISFTKFDFALNFIDYLKNATLFHEKEWKMVNRLVHGGEVYLSKQDVARLLQEEVRRYIESKINLSVSSKIPEGVLERVEDLKRICSEKIKEAPPEQISSSVIDDAFPPCMRELYSAIKAGRHVSHAGRFALTSFLLNVGMEPEAIIDLFRKSPDFNERIARYQIEHIAGEKGSRTRYTPPKCDTLRTHGLCLGADNLCGRVRHPLTYYLRRAKSFRVGEEERIDEIKEG
ncbi:MAG: DNA primase large subunit PriL [Candidatus Bathyarchaeota archaeon]|nr:DNA primase large subunit PriL [Candidatus Bathyarchaeota archaeon]